MQLTHGSNSFISTDKYCSSKILVGPILFTFDRNILQRVTSE